MKKAAVDLLIIICFCFFTSCSKKAVLNPQPVLVLPTITSLSASEGNYNSTVIITGTGFSTDIANDAVFFNGESATITAVSTTQLTVTVPQGASTGAIVVKVGGNSASGPTFTDLGVLAITSLSVGNGPYNTRVIVKGTGFSSIAGNNEVFFNGKKAAIVAAANTQLTVDVPLSAGTGNVSVAVNNGIPVAGPTFTYQLSAFLTVFAGSGKAGSNDGAGVSASFNTPTGLLLTRPETYL